MVQKIVNGIAIASGVVSLTLVGLGGYVFVRKDAIIDSVKEQAIDAVLGSMGGLGGLGGGGLPSTDLPLGTNDLATPSPTPQAAVPSLPSRF